MESSLVYCEANPSNWIFLLRHQDSPRWNRYPFIEIFSHIHVTEWCMAFSKSIWSMSGLKSQYIFKYNICNTLNVPICDYSILSLNEKKKQKVCYS
jgi:hypothetical protein